MNQYDYIVVGAGSAGCVLAARLSEDPSNRVCLIEAGKPDKNILVHIPAAVAALMSTKLVNYAFDTVPQEYLDGRICYQPRGKALGGSSSLNAMLYVRGNKWDYDNWAAMGNPGWSYEDVLPYFIKSEGNEVYSDDYHGINGPLTVSNPSDASELNDRFIKACQSNGIKFNPDYNGAEQAGCHLHQRTVRNGERCSTAKAFLTPNLDRPNLTVLTEAVTEKVILENGIATGIKVLHGGTSKTIKATKEVILSGGAFGSPQILMLSGIGSSDELSAHGIEPKVDLPGVGKNLQDHIDYVIGYRSSSNSESFGVSFRGVGKMFKAFKRWLFERRGMLTSTLAESGAFVQLDQDAPCPDMQFVFVVGLVDDHGRKLRMGHGFSCHATVLRPESTGTVTLKSTDPKDSMLIDPEFLKDNRDLQLLLKGGQLMRQVLESSAFDDIRGDLLYPCSMKSDAIVSDIKKRADTQYHPVGTCKMGPDSDPMAVVDSELRVKGVKGLRVVDASIMPKLVSGNTNAPAIMIGEKAADLILNAGRRVLSQTSEVVFEEKKVEEATV